MNKCKLKSYKANWSYAAEDYRKYSYYVKGCCGKGVFIAKYKLIQEVFTQGYRDITCPDCQELFPLEILVDVLDN